MQKRTRHRTWLSYQRQRRRIAGVVVTATGIGLLSWAGLLSSTTAHPPTTPELAVVLIGAAAFQISGGATFGRIGHVDAEKAKSAVRRLLAIGNRAAGLQGAIQDALHDGGAVAMHNVAIRTDEALSGLTSNITDAIKDWMDVQPEVLAQEQELEAELLRQRDI